MELLGHRDCLQAIANGIDISRMIEEETPDLISPQKYQLNKIKLSTQPL